MEDIDSWMERMGVTEIVAESDGRVVAMKGSCKARAFRRR